MSSLPSSSSQPSSCFPLSSLRPSSCLPCSSLQPLSSLPPSSSSVANPGPLGLFGFALTTFVISAYNSGLFRVEPHHPTNQIMGLAIFYGGIAQFVAGMWEFIRNNPFGATAFASYGAFWTCNGFMLIPALGVDAAYLTGEKASKAALRDSKAIVLLGWTIFTLLMTVLARRVCKTRLFALFCLVLTTLVLLTTAEFANAEGVEKAGGYVGLITAALAWFNAFVDLLECYPVNPNTGRGKSQVGDSHHNKLDVSQ